MSERRLTVRPEVRLGEYASVNVAADQLTERDLARLEALQAQGKFTVSPTRTGWRLTADATVGVLVLDRIRLVVEPKFALPGDRLIRWLCYALGTPVPHPATLRRWATDQHGYADLVAAALLAECRALLLLGLRRDYRRTELVEPVLRGRLDVAAQAGRRYGMLDRLHVRTFERAEDIWENRICGTALRAAVPATANPALARALSDTAAGFPADTAPAASLHALARARYSRLNTHYRAAHTWAGLILRGGGVSDLFADLGPSAESLLLDLPPLWEAVVHRLAAEAAAPLGGHVLPSAGTMAITTSGDISRHPPFRPDVLLDFPQGGPLLLPVDAKYKRYGTRSVSAADVHQLLTYAAGYAVAGRPPAAAILYPSPTGFGYRTLRADGPAGALGTIEVIGIDTATEPDHAVALLREAWARALAP